MTKKKGVYMDRWIFFFTLAKKQFAVCTGSFSSTKWHVRYQNINWLAKLNAKIFSMRLDGEIVISENLSSNAICQACELFTSWTLLKDPYALQEYGIEQQHKRKLGVIRMNSITKAFR